VARLLLGKSAKLWGRDMNKSLIVAISLISTGPLCSQGAQPDATKLKADAQKVVSVIKGDKAKTQVYCEILELTDEAEQEENPAKTAELSERIDNLEGKLGPEFITLVHALTDIDAHSQDAHDIRSIIALGE
jgi:hypothetical protein